MKQRLDREVTRSQAAELWSATYILMGARYADALIETLLAGVLAMEESVTYQKIIRKGKAEGLTEGRVEGARRILLLLGRDHFGEPSADEQAVLDAVVDVNRLEELAVRLKHVSSWHELLGVKA